MNSNIRTIIDEDVAKIIFCSSHKKNAIDIRDLNVMGQFLEDIKIIPIRCLVITGEGDTFSSGMVLDELRKGYLYENPFSPVCEKIENLPFVSIALLNGGVFGGSVELALSCDFRVGCANTMLQIPASRFGIHYGINGIKKCLSIFGLQVTRKLLLLSEVLSYENLISLGFLDYHAQDLKQAELVLTDLLKDLSNLSNEAISSMKATLRDISCDQVDLNTENFRFVEGFKSGRIEKRLEEYFSKKARK